MDRSQLGFTLVELMVTLALSSLLLLGVGAAFLSIKQTAGQIGQLETTQEVIRSAQVVLSRSIKQAAAAMVIDNELLISQTAVAGSITDCLGRVQPAAFTERFRLQGTQLQCQVAAEEWVTLLSGTTALQFNVLEQLVSIRLATAGLSGHFPETDIDGDGQPERFIQLDFALKSQILSDNT